MSLLEAGLELEEFGGDVQAVEISALKVVTCLDLFSAFFFFSKTTHGLWLQKINLDKLENAIMAAAELQDLRGDRYSLHFFYFIFFVVFPYNLVRQNWCSRSRCY